MIASSNWHWLLTRTAQKLVEKTPPMIILWVKSYRRKLSESQSVVSYLLEKKTKIKIQWDASTQFWSHEFPFMYQFHQPTENPLFKNIYLFLPSLLEHQSHSPSTATCTPQSRPTPTGKNFKNKQMKRNTRLNN